MFSRYIGVLDVLAQSPKGATVGQVQKLNWNLSRGMIERTLRDLISEELVTVEGVQYRRNIVSKRYHITEKAVEYCEYVVTKYDKNTHQKTMELKEAI